MPTARFALLFLPLLFAAAPNAFPENQKETRADSAEKRKPPSPNPSAKTRTGKASYYSRKFTGKKMADGTPMNPRENIAASKSLPLGTTAEVTNLENGKSTEVKIRDRGPYVPGRIIDLSPKAAEEIGMKEDGVAPVAVTPLEFPQPEKGTKSDDGQGAGKTSGK